MRHSILFVCVVDMNTQFRRWTIGERLPQVVNVGGNPRACDVSPDGSLVAVGFQDGAVRVYSLSSNEMAAEQRAHSRGVSVVRFSPDGKLLASGGHDSKIVFYNADSGFSVAGEMNVCYCCGDQPSLPSHHTVVSPLTLWLGARMFFEWTFPTEALQLHHSARLFQGWNGLAIKLWRGRDSVQFCGVIVHGWLLTMYVWCERAGCDP